jgi:hypothetical protein
MEATTIPNSAARKCGRRYGQAQREAILARFRESGMEVDAFARQADVSGTTIKRWMGGGRSRPKLVAVGVKESAETSGFVEARFGCGTILRVPAVHLGDLVRSLRRLC